MTSNGLEDDFDPVTLDDIQLIQSYLDRSSYEESNHNVLNMIIWMNWYPLYKVICDNYCLLLGMHENEMFLYMPLCEKQYFDDAIKHAKNIFEQYQKPFVLSSFTKEMSDRVQNLYPTIEVIQADSSSDYVYETERLISLSGKKLQKKRNHLNAFYKEYKDRYVFEELNDSNIEECKVFLSHWEIENQEDDYYINEKKGVEFILTHFHQLNSQGGCIKIDGEVKAFAIGSRLTDTMCQMNVEKADSSIRGLYQAIMCEVLQRYFSNFKECNREDDLGLENLRHAKRAYAPSRMIEKYRLVLI